MLWPLFLGAVHFAGDSYRLLGVDLAELPTLEEALCCAGLDPQGPTLLLAEVALTYMEVERCGNTYPVLMAHLLI